MVAKVLGVPSHSVVVEVRRMGGGFGGKETQMNLWAAIAALAAKKLGRPVKLRPDRDDDMVATGKRHDFGIVAVESEAPFGVRAAPVSEQALCVGRLEYRQALRGIANARQSHVWPGYSNPDAWQLPAYASPACELVVGTDVVTL